MGKLYHKTVVLDLAAVALQIVQRLVMLYLHTDFFEYLKGALMDALHLIAVQQAYWFTNSGHIDVSRQL